MKPTCTLTTEMKFNPDRTDADSLATALDRLIETAVPIAGGLAEYGRPKIGPFFVAPDPDRIQENIAAISAEFHSRHSDYKVFYARHGASLGGFPTIWELMVRAGRAFAAVEPELWSNREWTDAVEAFVARLQAVRDLAGFGDEGLREMARAAIEQQPQEDEPATVRVTLEGGVIQHIEHPEDMRVVVRDYDTDGIEPERLSQDEEGTNCIETVW